MPHKIFKSAVQSGTIQAQRDIFYSSTQTYTCGAFGQTLTFHETFHHDIAITDSLLESGVFNRQRTFQQGIPNTIMPDAPYLHTHVYDSPPQTFTDDWECIQQSYGGYVDIAIPTGIPVDDPSVRVDLRAGFQIIGDVLVTESASNTSDSGAFPTQTRYGQSWGNFPSEWATFFPNAPDILCTGQPNIFSQGFGLSALMGESIAVTPKFPPGELTSVIKDRFFIISQGIEGDGANTYVSYDPGFPGSSVTQNVPSVNVHLRNDTEHAPDTLLNTPGKQHSSIPSSNTDPTLDRNVNLIRWIQQYQGSTQTLRFETTFDGQPGYGSPKTKCPASGVQSTSFTGQTHTKIQLLGIQILLMIEWANPTPVGGAGDGANGWNFEDSGGHYHRAVVDVGSGTIHYGRSDFAYPKTYAAVSSVGSGAFDPHPIVDYRNRAWLHWAVKRDNPSQVFDTYYTYSDDDGKTWKAATLLIPGGSHPTVTVSNDLNVVIWAAYVDTLDDVGDPTGIGTIQILIQTPADNIADLTPITILDDHGDPFGAADDTFHIVQGREGPARWLLALHPADGDFTAEYWSADDCRTIKAVN